MDLVRALSDLERIRQIHRSRNAGKIALELGIAIDPAANELDSHEARQIGTASIPVWVVPTDEELLIARDTLRCIQG